MITIVLIASPLKRNLEASLVDSLRNAWGGGAVQWLSPDEAAEFEVDELPSNVWSIWQDLQNAGVDLVPLASTNRKKSVLLADMDSTMIREECIDELAAEAGVGERVADITRRAMNGEIDFEGALKERVGLLKGQKITLIDTVLQSRISLASGGKTLLATMRANGGYAALVSGGFTAFTAKIADSLGFHEHRANTLIEKDGVLTGEVGSPILGRDAKVTALSEITNAHNLTPASAIAVGDGANDLGMLNAAGIGVALHAKPAVAAEVDARINHGDLTSLLFLQGYTKDEFAE